jgi:hypothetical protein
LDLGAPGVAGGGCRTTHASECRSAAKRAPGGASPTEIGRAGSGRWRGRRLTRGRWVEYVGRVTIADLERRLPGLGFHEACLVAVAHDHSLREARLDLRVFVDERQSRWRCCRLVLTEVAFLTIDASTVLGRKGGPGVWVEAGSGIGKGCEARIPAVAEGFFVHWFYLGELRAFMHVAAKNAAFEWTGPEESVPQELRGIEMPLAPD